MGTKEITPTIAPDYTSGMIIGFVMFNTP